MSHARQPLAQQSEQSIADSESQGKTPFQSDYSYDDQSSERSAIVNLKGKSKKPAKRVNEAKNDKQAPLRKVITKDGQKNGLAHRQDPSTPGYTKVYVQSL